MRGSRITTLPSSRASSGFCPRRLPLPDRLSEVIKLLMPYRPDAVVVDTLNAYFGGGDENSTQDMTRFVTALRLVRDTVNCSVVTLHHTGLADSGRERGSGVLRGAADVIIQVAKDEAGTGLVGFLVVLGREVEGWSSALSLRLRPVDTDWLDDDGQVMTTCVVEAGNTPVTLSGRGGSGKQRTTIKVVEDLAVAKANGASTVRLERRDVVDEARRRGVSQASAYRHVDALAERMGWRLLDPGSLEVNVRSGRV